MPRAADQKRRYVLARELSRLGGAIALSRYQDQSLRIDTKVDRTLVTDADRDAERAMRERLSETFPDDAICGEEYGEQRGTSGWTWYLDPIDGTQAFARGVPLFGTLIGVTHEDTSRIGIIFLPALGECVHAALGEGCHWERGIQAQLAPGSTTVLGWHPGQERLARVSSVASLREATFCTTWMHSFQMSGRRKLFDALCDATGIFRGWGDCYGYALVATGRADIMLDPELAPWDAGPMPIILSEAGGRYTSFQGSEDVRDRDGFATNGLLHQDVMNIIASSPRDPHLAPKP